MQERRQVEIDRRTAEQPDPGVEVDTISSVPSSTGAQRRASVQDTSTATTLSTPPTASEEWSTKSCPPSAIRITLNPPAPTPTMPEPIEAALEVNTPDIIEIASQTGTKDMLGLDSIISKHTTEPSASVTPNTSEQQIFATLANRNFHIPPSASLNSPSLILFKHDTPSLERFRLLHNQLFIELVSQTEDTNTTFSAGAVAVLMVCTKRSNSAFHRDTIQDGILRSEPHMSSKNVVLLPSSLEDSS